MFGLFQKKPEVCNVLGAPHRLCAGVGDAWDETYLGWKGS